MRHQCTSNIDTDWGLKNNHLLNKHWQFVSDKMNQRRQMPKHQLIPDRQEHNVFVFTTPDSMNTKHFVVLTMLCVSLTVIERQTGKDMRKITTSTWGRELWKNQTQPSVFKGNMQVSSFIKQIIHKIKCLLRKLKMLMLIDVLQNLQSKRTSWLSIISHHIKQRGDAKLLLKIYWDIVAVFKCTVHMREISWHIYRNIYHTLFKKKKKKGHSCSSPSLLYVQQEVQYT